MKQIKIGFDRTASRTFETDQILVDVRGNLLRDETGNYLYTIAKADLPDFYSERKSLSVSPNNIPSGTVIPGGAISIEEQFPELSEVSSSILGIPRKSVQKPLLTDVSVYGLDENLWEYYSSPSPYAPEIWKTRFNPVHGNRFEPKISEKPNQQAIALEAFPSPWTFPWSEDFSDQGRFNLSLYQLYANFIRMGNDLYNLFRYSFGMADFAEANFLPIIDSSLKNGGGAQVSLSGIVEYNSNPTIAMSYIEKWTLAWMNIRDGILKDPRTSVPETLKTLTFQRIEDLLGKRYTRNDTRPGYRSDTYYYAQIQSKEAFRYQPGAISSYTFGIGLEFDETTSANKIEWGCANETDQYMFQIAGSSFNIVRRSTIPLSQKALEENGLMETDQRIVNLPNPFERPGSETLTNEYNSLDDLPRYETVISQDNFNGDPLNGSGRSKYSMSFREVTMYKIEYSWYGAIGAKFYAYVPVGYGECRWVLMHTLIMENTLYDPVLRNPYMHFRYSLSLADTSSLRNPISIYKYGASYYIDNPDEGTTSFSAFSNENVTITNDKSKPLIGFQIKKHILNRDGVEIPNQKNFYMENISATASKNTRLDILECEGCKDGFGHFYTTSLVNTRSETSRNYRIVNGETITFANTALGQTFSLSDKSKKIIAPGIFNTYIIPDPTDLTKASITRKLGVSEINNDPVSYTFSTKSSALVGNTKVNLRDYTFSGKLFGFDDIAVANLPLTGNKIAIRFLNPVSLEPTFQVREFRIGVTRKVPSLDTMGKIVFDSSELNYDDEIYGEYSAHQSEKNIYGSETREINTRIGDVFEDDYRLEQPRGKNSGKCSTINVEVLISEFEVEYISTAPGSSTAGNFLVFEIDPQLKLLNGGLATLQGSVYTPALEGETPITFTTDLLEYINTGTGQKTLYAGISAPLVSIPGGKIGIRIIELRGRHYLKRKIDTFDASPLYVFVGMQSGAVVNNLVINEILDSSTLSYAPVWLIGSGTFINAIDTGAAVANSVFGVIGSNEYLDKEGFFNMGGLSVEGNPPSNFSERERLDGTLFDTQLNQPLRPGRIRYTTFIGTDETVDIPVKHIFGVDRYKLTRGTYGNKSLYINSRVLDTGATGSISINILGKEQ